MDDVLGQIMLTGADEDLVAGDGVRTIRIRLGLGAQQPEVGAAVRFGQAHGARPLARGDLRQIERLLLWRAMRVQAFIGTVGEARIHRPRLIGGVQHLVDALVDDDRQALATVLRVAGERRPAAFDELLVRLAVALRCLHLVRCLIEHTAFAVAGLIQRKQHFGGVLAALLGDRHDRVHVVVGMRGQRLQFGGHVEQLFHHKAHVAQRGRVSRHGSLLRNRAVAPGWRIASDCDLRSLQFIV